jgi:hypothetical protein
MSAPDTVRFVRVSRPSLPLALLFCRWDCRGASARCYENPIRRVECKNCADQVLYANCVLVIGEWALSGFCNSMKKFVSRLLVCCFARK